ncbi:unnamed protein product [Schistosoma turkestanicum]|nr:unnamed protein product [Schistosoma turkestanicum]
MKKSEKSSIVSTISQKRLKEIQGYLIRQNGIKQETHVNGRALGSLGRKPKISENETINSVLKDVIDLNSTERTEPSSVKSLSSVYLDVKPKLDADVSQDTTQQSLVRVSQNASKISVDSQMSDPSEKQNHSYMPASDENKHQRNKNVANSPTSTNHDRWSTQPSCLNKHNFQEQEASNVLLNTEINFLTSKFNPESSEKLYSPDTICANQIGTVPALTPMAFGSGQDAHLLKQEEKRLQWKAALDEQLKEQQTRGKTLQEVQNEGGFNKIQSGSLFNDRRHCDSSVPFSESSTSNPCNSALVSHPSASHFMSSSFFLPDSTVINNSHSSSGTKDAINQPWKLGFNRVRGFTQQLYTDLAESAERARLAHEARLINLKQIEEKRRQKEQEKAKLLMEEKMEEERIARERLRLQQMAEAENARKRAKDIEEFQRTQYLYESLVRAQEEAKRNKIRKHPCYSELKQNNDSVSRKTVIQSELHVPYWPVASVVENLNQNNPLYTFQSSSGCDVPDSIVCPKNSLAVQVSFPEDVGIQTENFECTNSRDKPVLNDADSQNRNMNTVAYKLTHSDNKSIKNNPSKMSQSVLGEQKQHPRKNCSTSNCKPTNNNSIHSKTKVSQTHKAKESSKCQSLNSDALCDNNFSKSTNEQSKLSISNGAKTFNFHADTNDFQRSVHDGSSSIKSRIPIPVSTAYRMPAVSLPKHQSSTANIESQDNATFSNIENPYVPMNFIRTYDVLNPIDENVIMPVSHEPASILGNTRKLDDEDSLLNRNTKHERLITQQDAILQQLSQIRKGLQLRQVFYQSGAYEDDFND